MCLSNVIIIIIIIHEESRTSGSVSVKKNKQISIEKVSRLEASAAQLSSILAKRMISLVNFAMLACMVAQSQLVDSTGDPILLGKVF